MKKYVAISISVIFLITGCSTYTADQTYNASVTNRLRPYDFFPKSTFFQIEKNPANYAGSLYAFMGDVIEAKETSDGIVFQMLMGSGGYATGSLVVVFPYHQPTNIAKGSEQVKVLGYIGNTVSGTNVFGGTITSLTMKAIAVNHGEVYFLPSEEENFRKWQSGELFSPKTDSPTMNRKTAESMDKPEALTGMIASKDADDNWTILEMPGAVSTGVTGIEDSYIVGNYITAFNGPTHGFIYNGATWITIDMPGAISTSISDINGKNIVGDYTDAARKTHGFLYNGATWTTIDKPGLGDTSINGIDGDNIVGDYYDNSGFHGFLYNGTKWTMLEPPGWTSDHDINITSISGNNIVGEYVDASGTQVGFLYDGTAWKILKMPVSEVYFTYIKDIDGSNIVGYYTTNKSISSHGLLFNGTRWTTLDKPGANTTSLVAISGNNIVGNYKDSPLSGISHGFIYKLPENNR